MPEYPTPSQGAPTPDGNAAPPGTTAPTGSSQGEDYLVFRRGSEEIRVPSDATMISRFEDQQYQLSAKDVRDVFVPKGHGFENRMRRLAAREKELREKYGDENLPLIDAVIEFKKGRLSHLPPEEVEYLRRYLAGDPEVSFSGFQGHSQRSRPGAHNSDYGAPSAPETDPYGYEEPKPSMPPEVLQEMQELRRSRLALEQEIQGIKGALARKDQEEAQRREEDRWKGVQNSIDSAISRSPILKRAGKRVAENVMMKYLTMKNSEGELIHDVDLAVRLVEQEVKEEHGRLTTEKLEELYDDQRRFTTVEPGGIPATTPANDFPEVLKKLGGKPLTRRGGMSAIGKLVLDEYRQPKRRG